MSHTVLLTVTLRITDNEARSALEALREKMGLKALVRDLARDELWEIGVEAGTADEALASVDDIVRATNIFANPNKHDFTLSVRDEARLDADEFAILVSDREGAEGQSVVSAVRRAGFEGVVSVRRWTRWRVRLTAEAVPGDPALAALVERIAVATGRHDGLLSNPHSQTSRVLLPWGEEKVLAA
jgi:phosphoribosylformylglycinamidine (FGAM) synthase PurS component